MEKINIPKEENKILEGQQKVMYVADEEGFHTENYGSSVEEFATQTAVEEFELLAKESLENKLSSPIEYFMYKNRMDISTLASVMGIFSFRVKRHLKMKKFQKLNDKLLNKYAIALNITIEELKGLKV
ncbi:hypothetical protein [Arcobacter sp. CECT 8985]|uniref:hypothetical protein n=1 Tax=Arcobacter sp. CECT 8985 TaxID=1935424 RepID=UPI00100C0D4E|nr:hypothetical protein [Arcobacter sp. CECT 8985]RXJ85604.1 hypothetical protein CRU93_10940 [Arcobacter sp. CECT 8985]